MRGFLYAILFLLIMAHNIIVAAEPLLIQAEMERLDARWEERYGQQIPG